MSKESELLCPECEGELVYCHGTIKVPYFRHKIDQNCELELTGETEEHKKGKMLIYDFLKRKHPEAYVDLEYKIEETGQRADVICIFPNGDKFALEMQCSKIPIDKWLDRFNLYEQAGINQIWFAGKNLVNELDSPEEGSTKKLYKFSALADKIYDELTYLPFLNVDNGFVDILHWRFGREEEYHRQRTFPSWVSSPLEEAYIEDFYLTTDTINTVVKERDELARKERELREVEYRKELEVMKKEKEETARIKAHKIEHANKYLNVIQKTNVKFIRDKLMSPKEQWLFNKLVAKHGYTIDNFPGIFQAVVNYMDLITTPPVLWQLWIYDNFIYNKKPNKDKIWVPKVKEQFEKMVKKGVFRIKYNGNRHGHFSFAVWDFIAKLEEIDVLTQLGFNSRKYYQINNTEIPIIEDITKNKLISLGFSYVHTGRNDFNIINHFHCEDVQLELAMKTFRDFRNSMIQVDKDNHTEIDKVANAEVNEKPIQNTESPKDKNKEKKIVVESYLLAKGIVDIYKSSDGEVLSPKGLFLAESYLKKIISGEELSQTEETVLLRIQGDIEKKLGANIWDVK